MACRTARQYYRHPPESLIVFTGLRSIIMRSILIAEVKAVRSGGHRERRTMRSLWYELVKPVLSRAGILNKKTAGGKAVRWDGKLSIYLAELVRAGFTSYEELLIIDGSRQRQPAHNINIPVANVQMVGAHFPWVILFTEKDTIWQELQGLADLYGVSAISGSGQPALACTENTIRAIVRSESFQEELPESIILLALTDYDPAGFDIFEAQREQIIDTAGAMDDDELGNLRIIDDIRIGINPNQLDTTEREANSYEPKDQGLDDWFRLTGGVDGKRLGLELDALPLSQLRRMFAEAIEQRVDIEKRRRDLREFYIDIMACNLLLPDFEKKRKAMIEAVRSNGCWEKIQATHIPDDLFTRTAIEGDDMIAPVQNLALFTEYHEQVKNTMRMWANED